VVVVNLTLMMKMKILNSKKKYFQLSHSNLVKILLLGRIIIIINSSLLIMELVIIIVLRMSNRN
jgi:hypothetical protein